MLSTACSQLQPYMMRPKTKLACSGRWDPCSRYIDHLLDGEKVVYEHRCNTSFTLLTTIPRTMLLSFRRATQNDMLACLCCPGGLHACCALTTCHGTAAAISSPISIEIP